MARHNFRKLTLWIDGASFAKENYQLTKKFSKEEQFNLISQMNRAAAVSIPSNISEGSAKSSDKHFKVFLENSLGSAFEWETQLEIAKSENFVPEDDCNKLIIKIHSLHKRIGSFIDRLN